MANLDFEDPDFFVSLLKDGITISVVGRLSIHTVKTLYTLA